MLRFSQLGFLLFLLSAVMSPGCGGGGPALVPVSGTVVWDNQPLAEGTISFKTIQTGVTNTFPVKDGKFEGMANEGERRVEINAYRKRTITGPMGGEVQESLIARRYNLDSTLTATVTSGGPNEFKFTVGSK